MAQLNNESKQEQKNTTNGTRAYATDEAGMMADAKEYAKRDMSTIVKVLDKLQMDTENQMELIVKAVIAVKYEQIEKARCERPAWEKFLD